MDNRNQIQDWVYNNTKNYEFAALISSLRGIDIDDEFINEQCKKVSKLIRYAITNPFNKNTTYATISKDEELQPIDVCGILYLSKSYSEHWYSHITHTIKIIKNKNPNPYIGMYWKEVLSELEKEKHE